MRPAATTPANPFPSIHYTRSISKTKEIIFPKGDSTSTEPSLNAIKALSALIVGTNAALLTAGLRMASQTFEEANDKNGAKWMDRGASFWLCISIAFFGAAAYFCILDKLAKRSNDADSKTTCPIRLTETVHKKSTFSMSGSDLA